VDHLAIVGRAAELRGHEVLVEQLVGPGGDNVGLAQDAEEDADALFDGGPGELGDGEAGPRLGQPGEVGKEDQAG
jgi:hypothetical protein